MAIIDQYTVGSGDAVSPYSISGNGLLLINSQFEALLPNDIVRGCRGTQMLSDSTTGRGFYGVVFQLLSGLFYVRHVSQLLSFGTVPQTAQGFTFSTSYVVPSSGSYYFGIKCYGSTRSPYIVNHDDTPAGCTTPTPNSVLYYSTGNTSPPSIGSSVNSSSFNTASTRTMIMVPIIDRVLNVIVDPSDLTVTPSVQAVPQIVLRQKVFPFSFDTTPAVTTPNLFAKVLIAAQNASMNPTLANAGLVNNGGIPPDDVPVTPSIGDAGIVLYKEVAPEPVTMTPSVPVVGMGGTQQIYPENVEFTASLASTIIGNLQSLRLAEGSSRTPDAGIDLDYPSGFVHGDSWYTKTLYRFKLVFHLLTDDEYHWLDGFSVVNRYNEIDYSWPFDSRTYRCLIVTDLEASLYRSDSGLGKLWNASFEMIGYELD